jgi:DNA repair exonuclease SbcCD ATPase subunit
MRITSLDVEGFGCLSRERFAFSPNLHLVVGPNEAGKSTLQQALLAALYGLEGADGESQEAGPARWRPWSGAAFGLTLEVELQDGMRVRIVRDWFTARFEMVDAASGENLLARFGHHLEAGPALLGVAREIFVNTAFVSRAEIARIENPSAMRQTLAELVDTGLPERSVRRALDRLQAERLRECGPVSGRSGPLRQLQERIDQLTRTVAQAELARGELAELAARRDALREAGHDDDAQTTLLTYSLRAEELSSQQECLEQARQAVAALREHEQRLTELHAFASFPSSLQSRVLELRTRVDAARAVEQAQLKRERGVQEQIASLRSQMAELDSRIAELAPTAGPPVAEGDEEEVRRLSASLALVETELPTARERLQRRDAAARHAEARLEGYSLTADWEERRLVFHKGFSQWMEQAQASHETRSRMDGETADLQPLQEENDRIKKAGLVLDDILAAERQRPALEERLQHASTQERTAGIAIMVFGVLVVLGILLAFYGLLETTPYYLGGLALGGLALLAVFGAFFKQQDFRRARRALRREIESSEVRRRLLLDPFDVASGSELQRLQIDHLERVQGDAARLALQRQLTALDVRAQESATALQRLVASWGLPVPNATETSFQQAAVLIERLVADARSWVAAEEARAAARHQLDEYERQRDGLRSRLREALAVPSPSESRDILGEADQFLARRAARRRLDQLSSQLEQARARITQLEEAGRRRAEAEAETARFALALREVYQAAGVEAQDLDAAHALWDAGVRQEAAHAVASAQAKQLRAELVRVLDGLTIAALEDHVRSAQAAVQALPTPDADALKSLGQVPRASLERMWNDLRQRRDAQDRERMASENRLSERWARLAEAAPLREELAQALAQQARLRERAAALDLAIATLTAAARHVRRDVAGGLARELSARLASVTEHRYVQALVDEELAVRVRSGNGRLTRVEVLSQGTRNLIYLLERVLLSQWMSAGKEPLPVLLDDALAYCDARRLDQALAALEDLGRETQVILFTKDEALADHARIRRAWQVTYLQRRDAPLRATLAQAS